MPKKLITAAVAAFALYYAVTNPTQAAAAVRTLFGGIAAFASAVVGGAG